MSTAASPRALSAALLAIGDEVLRGEIVNGNAAALADRLLDLGIAVRRHLVVSDDPSDIREALEQLSTQVDVIVTTGGLGPTEDDRTVDVVCALLGKPPVTHDPSREAMERRFAKVGFTLTPNNLRQVRVPTSAEPLPNAVGIAPGFRVRIGAADAFFLPGVPREMEAIMVDHIVPALRRRLVDAGAPVLVSRVWHVYGVGESHVDHQLAGLMDGLSEASLHFRTELTENHVKVLLRTTDLAAGQATLARLDAEIRTRLGDVVYGTDDDTLPSVLGRSLRETGATLAFAESCTGGYAGQLVTSEPGSSDYFRGGIMAYANEIKVNVLGVRPETLAQHGAVSEPCAVEMAQGAQRLCEATWAVSITGIAGSDKHGRRPIPDPAPGEKPVGLVCFGVAGPHGVTATTKRFVGGRERIRRAAACFAMDLARRACAGVAGHSPSR
jgi:nicotinamide-nucleotide amidase